MSDFYTRKFENPLKFESVCSVSRAFMKNYVCVLCGFINRNPKLGGKCSQIFIDCTGRGFSTDRKSANLCIARIYKKTKWGGFSSCRFTNPPKCVCDQDARCVECASECFYLQLDVIYLPTPSDYKWLHKHYKFFSNIVTFGI